MKIGGIIVSVLVIAFMTFDSVTKMIRLPAVIKAQAGLGWPDRLTVPIGAVLFICTVLYAIPRTSVFGAVLLTAWLGGATAEKVRLEDKSFLFSVVFGILVWLGIFLRSETIRDLIPYVHGDHLDLF